MALGSLILFKRIGLRSRLTTRVSTIFGGTSNPYASGLTFFFRHTADASVKGSLIKFGTKATAILSGVGPFTAGFNLPMAAQCELGIQ